MKIKSLGHACFTASDGQHTVIFDPFLEGNPEAAIGPEEVEADAVLPSHGQGRKEEKEGDPANGGSGGEMAGHEGAPVLEEGNKPGCNPSSHPHGVRQAASWRQRLQEVG